MTTQISLNRAARNAGFVVTRIALHESVCGRKVWVYSVSRSGLPATYSDGKPILAQTERGVRDAIAAVLASETRSFLIGGSACTIVRALSAQDAQASLPTSLGPVSIEWNLAKELF